MNHQSLIINHQCLILAVETSGRFGSVAIAQGTKLLAEKQFSAPLRASAEIFPVINELLGRQNKKANQIEQVCISVGPGSFTGLRIAVALAKTMALANNIKIVAVDTLDCIAANVFNPACPLNAERCPLLLPNERLAVILDAKRNQFFIAVFDQTENGWEKILPDSLLTADEFLGRFTDKPVALIGEGLVYYKDKFNNPTVRVLDEKLWYPTAVSVHRLGFSKAQKGVFADPLTLTPNYLRAPDVKTSQIM